MAKPSWISLSTTTGTNNGKATVSVTTYTGRNNRTGTITATTAGGATASSTVTQSAKTEFITISSPTDLKISVGNTGGKVAIIGKSNSKALKIVAGLSASVEFNTTPALYIEGQLVSKRAVDGSIVWNGSNLADVPDDPGSSAQYNFTIEFDIKENKSVSTKALSFLISNNGVDEALVQTDSVVITQVAGVKNYAVPKITVFSYNRTAIPAAGGKAIPSVTYSQTWGWNDSTTDGGTITTGGQVTYTDSQDLGKMDRLGVVTVTTKGDTVSERTLLASVSATVSLNGKTSAATTEVDIYQAANTYTLGEITWGSRTPSIAEVPAGGGTVNYGSVTWSGSGTICTQTITWTSGATATITDSVGYETTTVTSAEQIVTYLPIKLSSNTVTVQSRTDIEGPAQNVGTLTITAIGAKSAAEVQTTGTKTLTIRQQLNSATYSAITLTHPDSVSLNAAGDLYHIETNMTLSQTVTYTSGTRKSYASADFERDYTVKTALSGFSMDDYGNVTVTKNPTVNARNGFVVTVSVTGGGAKTATKNITFNQQGSKTTIAVSPTTLTFPATGTAAELAKEITITSNDSWTLS